MSSDLRARHQSACRMFGYCLTAGVDSTEPWNDLADVWAVRLTLAERAAVAYAALMSLPGTEAEAVCDATFRGAGSPLPAFTTFAEAELWAEWASVVELKHYLVAAWDQLSPHDHDRFLARDAERRRAPT